MPDLQEITDHNGIVRKMGWVAPDRQTQKMRASRTSIQSLRMAAGLPPLIPQSDWHPVDFYSDAAGFGTKFITDQKSSSGCVGWSTAQALMRSRALRGMLFQILSGAYVYSKINGGRDQGANILDAMTVIETQGTCLQSTMDLPNIFNPSPEADAEAARFMENLSITAASSAEAVTCLLMGMPFQGPIMVDKNFENFDGNGVAGLSKSSNGNHSIHLAGLELVGGVWYFRCCNSWGPNWGPFKDGTVRLSMAHIDNCASAEDGYAHASATFDPQANQIPTPV